MYGVAGCMIREVHTAGSFLKFSIPPGESTLLLTIPNRWNALCRTAKKFLYWEKIIDFAPGSCSRNHSTCLASVSIFVPKDPSRSMFLISLRSPELISL